MALTIDSTIAESERPIRRWANYHRASAALPGGRGSASGETPWGRRDDDASRAVRAATW